MDKLHAKEKKMFIKNSKKKRKNYRMGNKTTVNKNMMKKIIEVVLWRHISYILQNIFHKGKCIHQFMPF